MPLKFCKKCEFWLTVLTLSQLGLLYVMMSKFYSQLEGGGILKKLSDSKLGFQISTFLLILFNFHIQARKACRGSHGYRSKRTSLILAFISFTVSIGYFLLFLYQSTMSGADEALSNQMALIGSASFFVLWMAFTVQYYRVYEYVDSLIKINEDNGITLTETAAIDYYRIVECERAYLENESFVRKHIGNCPVEHAEFYFLQKMIDALEKFKLSSKNMYKLDDVIHTMKARANYFGGLTESDKQRYIDLATRFPKIVQPSKDPYYGD